MTTEDCLNELMTEIVEAFTLNRPLLPILMKASWSNMTLMFHPEDITRPYLMTIRLKHGMGHHILFREVLLDTETVLTSAFYAKPKPKSDDAVPEELLDKTDLFRNFFSPQSYKIPDDDPGE